MTKKKWLTLSFTYGLGVANVIWALAIWFYLPVIVPAIIVCGIGIFAVMKWG